MLNDSTKVTVRLIGADDADGAGFLADFRHFCDGLEACLKRAEKLATGHSGRVVYRIAGLAMGSAQITLQAVKQGVGRDPRVPVLRFFRKTVTAIQSGKRLDPRVGPDDVTVFKKLASPLSGQSKALFIDDVEITPQSPLRQRVAHARWPARVVPRLDDQRRGRRIWGTLPHRL